MTTQRPEAEPTHSLAVRKAFMCLFAVPVLAAFVVLLLQHKGFIDVAEFGLPVDRLLYGSLAAAVVGLGGIFAVWRCPGCSAYLGKEASPASCPGCGARFR